MPFDPNKPYGNAEWAQLKDLQKGGMLKQKNNSVFLGFHHGRKIFTSVQGGLLTIAAPRSGKFSKQISWALMGSTAYQQSILCLDPKGELAAVSRNQMFSGKTCYYYNPDRLHGLPHMSINPLDHIVRGSRKIVTYIKAFYGEWHPYSASSNGRYFEITARDIAEAITLTEAERNGSVDLPKVHHLINLIETDSPEWFDFEFDMSISQHVFVRRVVAGLIQHNRDKRKGGGGGGSGGGMNAVLGELYTSFSCLNDLVLRESISPPFDFSFADICRKDAPPVNFYMMIPFEFISIWSPVIKALCRNAKNHKSRAPDAPPQLWLIDECGQLERFPLITELFTAGAGQNIRPWIFLQSFGQLKKIDDGAESVIPSSAAVQCYFAINDHPSAERISKLIGQETMELADSLQQRQSRLEANRLGREILAGFTDKERIEDFKLHKQAAVHLNKEPAPLMLPDQIIHKLGGRIIVVADDMDKSILLDSKDYYKAPEMSGYYHPSPYYPPLGSLKLPGKVFARRVIREPVPSEYSHYPQYADGFWSYIKGYKP